MPVVMPAQAVGLGLAELIIVAAVGFVVALVVVIVVVVVRAGTRTQRAAPVGRPAGWYDDPTTPGMITYWTGTSWDWSSRRPRTPANDIPKR